MNRDFLDPTNYQFIGRLPIQKDKNLTIPDSWVLSKALLVRWTILNLVKGATIDQIQDATLSNWLTIPGLGQFDPVQHQLTPSIQGRERVQLISINPTLPLEWRIEGVDRSILNSTLEFYSIDIMAGSFNNPVSAPATDLSPLVAAIAAGTSAQIAATQQVAKQLSPTLGTIQEKPYMVLPWSREARRHIAAEIDPNRIGGTIFNNGSGRVYIDRFMDIGQKTTEASVDGYIDPGGSYTLSATDAIAGILLYTLSVRAEVQCLLSLEIKAA